MNLYQEHSQFFMVADKGGWVGWGERMSLLGLRYIIYTRIISLWFYGREYVSGLFAGYGFFFVNKLKCFSKSGSKTAIKILCDRHSVKRISELDSTFDLSNF